MKKFKIYLTMLLLTMVAVSCFEENDFTIPDEFAWVGFEKSSFNIGEDSGDDVTATLIVSSATLSSALNLTYTVTSSDALEGIDYSLPSGTGSMTVPAGSNTVDIVLIESVLNNDNVTGDRTVVFEITDAGGLNFGGPDGQFKATVTVVLAEDDFTQFGYSSFEDVDVTGLGYEYTRPGGPDPALVNNPGDAPVDFVATGNELGFDSSFDPNDVGDDGGEIIGVSNGDFSAGGDGVYTIQYGSQAYSSSDLDGTLEIVFDEVTIPGGTTVIVLDMAVYFAFLDGGDLESDEGIELVWRTAQGDETVLAAGEDGGELKDMNGNTLNFDEWHSLTASVQNNIITGRPVVRIKNDNNDDLSFVDMIVVKGF